MPNKPNHIDLDKMPTHIRQQPVRFFRLHPSKIDRLGVELNSDNIDSWLVGVSALIVPDRDGWFIFVDRLQNMLIDEMDRLNLVGEGWCCSIRSKLGFPAVYTQLKKATTELQVEEWLISLGFRYEINADGNTSIVL